MSAWRIETRTVAAESHDDAASAAEAALTEVLKWFIEDGWTRDEWLERAAEKWDALEGEFEW